MPNIENGNNRSTEELNQPGNLVVNVQVIASHASNKDAEPSHSLIARTNADKMRHYSLSQSIRRSDMPNLIPSDSKHK
jgi:hypothetical protein